MENGILSRKRDLNGVGVGGQHYEGKPQKFGLEREKGHYCQTNVAYPKVIKVEERPAKRRVPVRELSRNLVSFYEHVNSVYYAQEHLQKEADSHRYEYTGEQSERRNLYLQAKGRLSSGGSSLRYTDENNDYIIRIGEMFANRYVVEEKIGKGSFGQVVSAFDQYTRKTVAIKIIKNKKPFFLQARSEINLLQEISINDPFDEFNVVKIYADFVHRGHQCIVCEKLDINLYDLLKKTQFLGLSLNLVRRIGEQVFRALTFLSRLDLIHCDLKPENILLKSPRHDQIKVIDVGSSCKKNNKMYKYIQSRFYRAPEVIIEGKYSDKIDVWSCGAMLVELHTGEPLFPGANEQEQILRFVKMKGVPSSHILDAAEWNNPQAASPKVAQFFQKNFLTRSWELKPNYDRELMNSFPSSLGQVLGLDNGSRVFQRRYLEAGHSLSDYKCFLDLIGRTLEYDQDIRPSAEDCIRHPFFSPVYQDQYNALQPQGYISSNRSYPQHIGRKRTGSV
eukprot:augustus_masked-scaffold_2-processed-gene-18.11-mRNA-1 protein AED:0.04 eAED:0.04 QI:0/-1/0/1/-1/1/1/0/505